MGRKNSKGSVSVGKDKSGIRLRWGCHKKRYSLNLFLFNATNLKIARKIAVQIESDLLTDNFDISLNRYRFGFTSDPKSEKHPYQLYEQWVSSYLHRDCEKQMDYWAFRNMLKRWGSFPLSDALHRFNTEKISERTYNRRLNMIRKLYDWLKIQSLQKLNPFDLVRSKNIPRKTNEKKSLSLWKRLGASRLQ